MAPPKLKAEPIVLDDVVITPQEVMRMKAELAIHDLQAQDVAEIQRDRFFSVIDNCLGIVAKQVEFYKDFTEAGNMLPVRDVKSITEVAANLFAIASTHDTQQKQKQTAVKYATIRSVDDIAKLLKEADPHIDYAELIEDAKDDEMF